MLLIVTPSPLFSDSNKMHFLYTNYLVQDMTKYSVQKKIQYSTSESVFRPALWLGWKQAQNSSCVGRRLSSTQTAQSGLPHGG